MAVAGRLGRSTSPIPCAGCAAGGGEAVDHQQVDDEDHERRERKALAVNRIAIALTLAMITPIQRP
jgi:hypothetical protein